MVAGAFPASVMRPMAPSSDSTARFHSYVDVALADRGRVFWYGHELRAPYQFRIDEATAELLVNGFPLLARNDSLPAPPKNAGERRRLSIQAGDEFTRLQGEHLESHEMLERVAKVYREARDLVDSVRVRDDKSLWIYWKGDAPAFAEWAGFPREEPSPLAESAARARAKKLARALQDGSTVFFGDGDRIAPPERRAEIDKEIAALKKGEGTPAHLFTAKMEEQFRTPPPPWKLIFGKR